MRTNTQMHDALVRAGFKAHKEVKRDTQSRYDGSDKPTWESLSQFEREYYAERFVRWQANNSFNALNQK